MDTTPTQLLALLRPLFLDSAILRFLSDTEPDASGGELHRIRIDFAHDAISLRIPRSFVDEYCAGASSHRELNRRLLTFVSRKLKYFVLNPGPRLRPVATWTFTEETF